MKVLFIGTEFFDYPGAMENAIKELGHEVVSYVLEDDSKDSLYGHMHAKIWFMKHGISEELYLPEDSVWERQSKNVYELYQVFQPDLLIGFAAYILTAEVLQKMDRCKKVLWIYDAIHNVSRIKDKLKYYDCVYTFEGTDVKKISTLTDKALFLPLCADGRYYHPLQRNKEYDLSFIGALSKERRALLRAVKEKFFNKKITAYGRYLGKRDIIGHLKRNSGIDKEIFTNCNIGQKESNELYARSRICLNMHKKQTKYGGNMRLYELMAAGAFQLVDKNEYIDEEFHGCLDTFSCIEELMEKLAYYWEHEKERERIALRGYEKVLKEDMFINRVKFIFDTV